MGLRDGEGGREGIDSGVVTTGVHARRRPDTRVGAHISRLLTMREWDSVEVIAVRDVFDERGAEQRGEGPRRPSASAGPSPDENPSSGKSQNRDRGIGTRSEGLR